MKMKTKIVALLAIVALSLTSCGLDDLLSVNINLPTSSTWTITGGLAANTAKTFDKTIVLDSIQAYKDNKTQITTKLTDASVKSITLSIVSPSDVTFSDINYAEAFVKMDANDTAPLSIGKTNFTTGGPSSTSITLTPDTNAALKKYIQNGQFIVHASITSNKDIPQDVVLQADISYDLKVDPIK